MTVTQFTPGPWSAPPYSNVVGLGIVGPIGRIIATVPNEKNWPAEMKAEQAATARLIAAAPELYEALEAVKEASLFVDKDGVVRVTNEPVISDELFENICAALAKARGDA